MESNKEYNMKLSVGNLIMEKYSDRVIVVESISDYGINLVAGDGGMHCHYNFDDVKPIQLTDEIVRKHQEEEWEFTGFGTRLIWQHKKYKSIQIESVPSNQIVVYINEEPINVKDYFHEWQNLFFCLTGEELNIEL